VFILTWIVNPFDPLPGDPDEPEGRYATLARILTGNGHKVCWWTSAFSHRFKKYIDQPLRPLCSVGFLPWGIRAKKAYKSADAVIGLTETYIAHVDKVVGHKEITAVIPLGLDCELFDSAGPKGCCEEFTKPAGEVWFTYAGSLTRSHDFLTAVKAFSKIYDSLNVKTRLFVAGQGHLSGKLARLIQGHGLENVTQTGFLDLSRLAYLLTQCDVGFNPSWPETMIYLPYKLFYYFAAGLAILNTMPGECSRIIGQNQCGLDYRAGDVDSCAEAIRQIVSDTSRLHTLQRNSRRMAESVYDRKILYQKYANLIEEVTNM